MKIDITAYGEDRSVEIEIHDFDTWNLDGTLALVIAPALKKFRENLHSYPSQFSEPEYGGSGGGIAEWREVLDKMIWSFEQISTGAYYDYGAEDIHAKYARIQEGLDLFSKYYMNLWD